MESNSAQSMAHHLHMRKMLERCWIECKANFKIFLASVQPPNNRHPRACHRLITSNYWVSHGDLIIASKLLLQGATGIYESSIDRK